MEKFGERGKSLGIVYNFSDSWWKVHGMAMVHVTPLRRTLASCS